MNILKQVNVGRRCWGKAKEHEKEICFIERNGFLVSSAQDKAFSGYSVTHLWTRAVHLFAYHMKYHCYLLSLTFAISTECVINNQEIFCIILQILQQDVIFGKAPFFSMTWIQIYSFIISCNIRNHSSQPVQDLT